MTSTIQAGVFSDAPVMQEERLPPFLRITLRRWTKWYVGGSELFWPFTDATIRFFVALWFLRSGLVKAADWDTALLLAESEYPISWMSAYNAAVTGLAIELIAPILLILGLFTRPAALAMGALTIVSQAVYIPTTTNLIVIAILFWYLVHGPAALSIDRAVSSGMKQSALPLARPIVLAGEWLRNSSAPFVMAVIRFWLAVSLLAYAHVIDPPIIARTWLPITIFSGFPDWLALLSAGLLILGIAAGLVSYALFFLIGFFMIAGAHPNVTFFPFLLLAIYEAKGAGMMSADGFIWRWLERNVLFDREYADIPESWPHIVVVGAGFGGLAAVARLKRLPVRITLIDKRNYHLFQPLLYQIATATLNPSDIATPIRSLFGSDGNVRVLKGEVMGIDKDGQNVSLANGEVIAFDKLLIATGATHCYFGKDQWSEHAPGLKTIEDGVAVRGTILNAFEKAEASDDPERIKRLLTFVVVGAGPTGVELAGAIAELAKINVAREFRTVDPTSARVILVQSGDRILPAFPDELSSKAALALDALGVEIRLESKVTDIDRCHVRIGDEDIIETETVLWAAGVEASPAAGWLEIEGDKSGRIAVDEHMRVKNDGRALENIFAIGDTASSNAWDGNPVPGLAPAAKQAGIHVATVVERELLGKSEPKPFAYKHQGSLATIGRKSAVADFGRLRLSGSSAWWLWGLVHIGFLTGARNRVTVVVNWLWSFFARQSGVRLITERV